METGKEIKLDAGTNQVHCLKCNDPYRWNTDVFLNEPVELKKGKMVVCSRCRELLTDRDFIYLARKVEVLRQERGK